MQPMLRVKHNSHCGPTATRLVVQVQPQRKFVLCHHELNSWDTAAFVLAQLARGRPRCLRCMPNTNTSQLASGERLTQPSMPTAFSQASWLKLCYEGSSRRAHLQPGGSLPVMHPNGMQWDATNGMQCCRLLRGQAGQCGHSPTGCGRARPMCSTQQHVRCSPQLRARRNRGKCAQLLLPQRPQ